MSGKISAFRGALSIGLITGIIDALIVHQTTRLPLAPLLFFLPLVWIICCLLTRALFLLRPLRRLAEPAVLMAGPGLLIVSRLGRFLHFVGLSTLMSLAVCTGIAVTLALALPRFIPERAMAIGAIAGVVWLAATAPFAFRSRDEQNAVAANSIAPPGAPNVLLIFLDTVRYDDAQQLPNLTRLASTAVVFDRAWAPAPWTLPSHFAVLTGTPPWKVTYDDAAQRFLFDGPTLAERFAARGYATAAILGNPTLEPDPVFHRGFQHFSVSQRFVPPAAGVVWLLDRAAVEVVGWNPAVLLPPDWMNASEVSGKALQYIRRVKQQPYFLVLNYMDAHSPYYVERECRDGLEPATAADWKAWQNTNAFRVPIAPEPAARLRAQYRAAMRCMDRSIGALLDQVQRGPNGRPTVIAIVADHGEQFGRHDMVGHGQSLYMQVLHVPFILKAPDQQPQHVATEVSTLDLHRRLLRYLPESRQPWPPAQPVIAAYKLFDSSQESKGASGSCIVRGRYHLIQSGDGSELLYDIRFDADETTPLPIPANDRELAALQLELRRHMKEFDANAVALRSLHYLQ